MTHSREIRRYNALNEVTLKYTEELVWAFCNLLISFTLRSPSGLEAVGQEAFKKQVKQ